MKFRGRRRGDGEVEILKSDTIRDLPPAGTQQYILLVLMSLNREVRYRKLELVLSLLRRARYDCSSSPNLFQAIKLLQWTDRNRIGLRIFVDFERLV